MPFCRIVSAPNAETEIGTLCKFSTRRWAVTTITPMPLSSSAAGVAGVAVWAETMFGVAMAIRIAELASRLLQKSVIMSPRLAHTATPDRHRTEYDFECNSLSSKIDRNPPAVASAHHEFAHFEFAFSAFAVTVDGK